MEVEGAAGSLGEVVGETQRHQGHLHQAHPGLAVAVQLGQPHSTAGSTVHMLHSRRRLRKGPQMGSERSTGRTG